MIGFDKIRQSGFHADLIERLVKQVNGGQIPSYNLFLLETTFDDDSVFRHFDYLGLSGALLTSIHIDELAAGARWYMNLLPVRHVTGLEVAQVALPLQPADKDVPAATHGDAGDDNHEVGLTVVVSSSSQRSLELEPLRCDDPACTADHGYVGGGKDEGLVMTFGAQSASSNEDDAMEFVAALSTAMTL